MKCTQVQPGLVAYHFGIVSDEARGDIESHLLGCGECLRSFLALKRAIETGDNSAKPSVAARERLRSAVAQELGARMPRRQWSWWERPFAFGFAGSAVLASVIAMRVLTSGPGSPPRSMPSLVVPADPNMRVH